MVVSITVEFCDAKDEIVYSRTFDLTDAMYVSALSICNFLKDHDQEWFYYTIKKVEVTYK